jgi:hypothetical protein
MEPRSLGCGHWLPACSHGSGSTSTPEWSSGTASNADLIGVAGPGHQHKQSSGLSASFGAGVQIGPSCGGVAVGEGEPVSAGRLQGDDGDLLVQVGDGHHAAAAAGSSG